MGLAGPSMGNPLFGRFFLPMDRQTLQDPLLQQGRLRSSCQLVLQTFFWFKLVSKTSEVIDNHVFF